MEVLRTYGLSKKYKEKVVLDEEDVKKWLENEPAFIAYFTDYLVDYDYETANSKDYSKIVAQYMINSNDGEINYYKDENYHIIYVGEITKILVR